MRAGGASPVFRPIFGEYRGGWVIKLLNPPLRSSWLLDLNVTSESSDSRFNRHLSVLPGRQPFAPKGPPARVFLRRMHDLIIPRPTLGHSGRLSSPQAHLHGLQGQKRGFYLRSLISFSYFATSGCFPRAFYGTTLYAHHICRVRDGTTWGGARPRGGIGCFGGRGGEALDHVLDDRPEEAVLLLETTLILSQEPVEMMRQHPVKDRPLRMSRTIDSRHCGRMTSRNGPTSWR